MKTLSKYEHLHLIMYHSALQLRRQVSYCSNTICLFCVSQTCLGQSVSSQTVVVLLRNPLLTPTATSRCVGSVYYRSHLLGCSFCSVVRFCLKYTNCEDLSWCRAASLSLLHYRTDFWLYLYWLYFTASDMRL